MGKTVLIGLGGFGLAIGRRLHNCIPNEVIGVDLDPTRRQIWEALTNEQSLSRINDIGWGTIGRILIAVNTESQVKSVLDNIKEKCLSETALSPVPVHILSTVSPEFVSIFEDYAGLPLQIIELPLTGGEVGALSGNLKAMVAGDLSEEEERFLGRTLTSLIVKFPRYGDPALAKLLNNAVIAYQVAALEEVIGLAHKHNIDPRSALQVISSGSASSYISTALFLYNEIPLMKDMELLENAIGTLPQVGTNNVGVHFKKIRSLLSQNE